MKLSLALVLIVACGCSSGRGGSGNGNGDGSTNNNNGSADLAIGPGGGGDGGNQQTSCTIDQPQSTPLALPDTNASDGTQKTCKKDSDCTGGLHCVITADQNDGGPGFCVSSYTDTLNFVGFATGATLTDTSKLISVCATLEHSWFGDLQIDLISPDGKVVSLRQFEGRDVSLFFELGHPDYCDSDANPVAGKGYKYCWTATATDKMVKKSSSGYACGATCEQWDGSPNTCQFTDPSITPPFPVVPAGNYAPDVAFSALQGAQLNGQWTFRITDLWQVDNGFLFDWSIQFDSSLVADCGTLIQ